MDRYFGWKDYKDMHEAFEDYDSKTAPTGFPTDEEVILAYAEFQSYEASCLIYWKRDGRVHEAKCGHCSCYGFSDPQAHGNAFSHPVAITASYLDLKGKPYPINDDKSPSLLVAWDRLLESF